MREKESLKRLISPEEPGMMGIEVVITTISACIAGAIGITLLIMFR